MQAIPADFRARIMGVRQLAVVGLPLGLLISGPLIEYAGVATAFSISAVTGVLATALLWLGWRRTEARLSS